MGMVKGYKSIIKGKMNSGSISYITVGTAKLMFFKERGIGTDFVFPELITIQ
jgi:hypothetical protein